MKISYNWLREYVDLKVSAEKLAQILTMAGLGVEAMSKSGDDFILEIEVTANRPDWLSVIGLAREVAALTGGRPKVPLQEKEPAGAKPARKANRSGKYKPVIIKVEDKTLCPRYTARVIRNVKIAQSPAWLRSRVEAMGLRSVNNIVDITNFCLFETGEPMHAFDLERLSGETVIIRKAKKGEKLVVIDGAEKSLDETTLIIADDQKPVAIAGIMGGLNTEVTFSTKDVLLEAAYFDPIAIRRSARKLGISTDSSYRFERRVDISNVARASNRALGLILEIAGGEAGEFIDIKTSEAKPKTVKLRYGRVKDILGADVPPAKIRKIASSLGMKIRAVSKDGLKLEAPEFRYDLKAEIDVIEEIARVYGYSNIPATLPDIVEQPVRLEPDMILRNKIRECLTGIGADEIITYSLLSKKLIAAADFAAEDAIEIKNPLTVEQEAMRPSLVPGMLGALLRNINRKAKDLKLFELGNVYMKSADGGFCERNHLCIGITGQAFRAWSGGSRPADFFELKGMTEALFGELGIKNVSFNAAKCRGFSPLACAEISVAGQKVGAIGEVARKILHDFDIKEKVCLLEADAETILRRAAEGKVFTELPKYPSVSRDISIIAGKEMRNADVLAVIRAAAGPILKEARLVDRYEGKQIPKDRVSLTYRLEYQDPARTLEEKDVSEAHARVLRELDGKLGAKLR